MKLQDALNILGLTGEVTFEDAKRAYRKASMKYHPDRNPAGLEMMKAVNTAWATLQAWDFNADPVSVKEGKNNFYGDALNEALNAIIDLPGIRIEICGAWVWVSGDTKPVKDTLKEAGYKWASKKFQWYFRPEEYFSKSRGNWSMDDIRTHYGSEEVQTRRKAAIK